MEELFVNHLKESAVDIVVNSIKKLLLERKLKAGDKLPNETELSKFLGVSRGSVREAMKILSAYGLIDIKVGDGTYIASSFRSGMIEPLLYSFLLSEADALELAEFRKYIELDIVELIMEHRNENEKYIAMLKDNVAQISKLQAENADPEKFIENDMQFHELLGNACRNFLIETVYKFIMEFFKQSIAATHKMQEPGTKSFESHTLIINAIEANDTSIAKQNIDYTVNIWKDLQPDNSTK